MFFDIHGDIWTDVTVKRMRRERNIVKNHHLNRFRDGGQIGGIFVIWMDPPHDKRPKERLAESLKAVIAELEENRDILHVIYNQSDFYSAINSDKLAVMLGIEGLSGIGGDIDMIYSLHEMGFRHMGLTWNEQNELATGVAGDSSRGLTPLGKQAVLMIEKLGILLDISHANDATFWDIEAIATKPFIASHSNARSLCDKKRNLTDDQIKAIARHGGVIGINAYCEFVHAEPNKQDVEHMINHIAHIASIVGTAHIAFGFDFFEYLESMRTDTFDNTNYYGTHGVEDASQVPNLIAHMKKRGFTDTDIELISYKNFIRLLGD